MYNGKEIRKVLKKAAEPTKKANPYGKDVSQYGYRDDSPFRDSPSLNIFTKDGMIDMSNTGIPLVANGRFLPPYSGLHQFDTDIVNEVPLAAYGGNPFHKSHAPFNFEERARINEITMGEGGWLDELDEYQAGGPHMYDKKADYEASKRQPIYVNNSRDSKLQAYKDSLDAYNWNKTALDKVLKTGLSPRGSSLELDKMKKISRNQLIDENLKQYQDWGLKLTEKDVKKELDLMDPVNKGTGKLNRAIAYYNFPKKVGSDYSLAQYKKPVQPVEYQKEIPVSSQPLPQFFSPPVATTNTEPPTKDYTSRHVEFGPYGNMMNYYDASNKLLRSEPVEKEFGGEYEEFKNGGPTNPLQLSRNKRRKTHKNIQSSINELFLRNFTLYGPAGKNIYDPKAKYQDGGGLRAASTTGASPVSTQAPINPTNNTGWDWVAEKWKNRDQGPSDWNFVMPDKNGNYVDSGVDPFTAILSAPQQVVKSLTAAQRAASKLLKGSPKALSNLPNKLPGNTIGAAEDVARMKELKRYGLKVEPEFPRYQRKLDTDLIDYNREYGTTLNVKYPEPTNADKLTGQVGIPEYSEELMRSGTRPMVKSMGTQKEYDRHLNDIAEWKRKTGQPEDDMFSFFKKNTEEGDSEMRKIFPEPKLNKEFYLKGDEKRSAIVAAVEARQKEVPDAVRFINNSGDEKVINWMKTGNAKDVVQEMAGRQYKNIDKMSPQQLEKARQEVIGGFINSWKQALKNQISTPYTGKQAFQNLSPNKYGGQSGWLDNLK